MPDIVNFVTCCSRPQFLNELGKTIYGGEKDKDGHQLFEIRWHIIIDCNKTNLEDVRANCSYPFIPHEFRDKVSPGAGNMRNMAFRDIKDGWIHVMDDDNIVHDGFWMIMLGLTDLYTRHVLVGDQVMKNGDYRLRGRPEYMRRCAVDSASICWHASLSQGILWDETSYECDGIFVEWLAKNHPEKFVFTNVPISYYNWQVT